MNFVYSRDLLSLLCIFLSLSLSSALYFQMLETERKCFIKDIPVETLVIGNYKCERHDPKTGGFMSYCPGIGMHVEIRNPEKRLILSYTGYGDYSVEGKFHIFSTRPGEYEICLYTNTTKWFGGNQLRIHLNIKVGERAVDYGSVARRERLTELQLGVRQLLYQAKHITKEQDYQRYREERFRQQCDSTIQGVLWWSGVQTAILVILWQMQSRRTKPNWGRGHTSL